MGKLPSLEGELESLPLTLVTLVINWLELVTVCVSLMAHGVETILHVEVRRFLIIIIKSLSTAEGWRGHASMCTNSTTSKIQIPVPDVPEVRVTCPLLPSAVDKPLILFSKMFMIDVHSEVCIIIM